MRAWLVRPALEDAWACGKDDDPRGRIESGGSCDCVRNARPEGVSRTLAISLNSLRSVPSMSPSMAPMRGRGSAILGITTTAFSPPLPPAPASAPRMSIWTSRSTPSTPKQRVTSGQPSPAPSGKSCSTRSRSSRPATSRLSVSPRSTMPMMASTWALGRRTVRLSVLLSMPVAGGETRNLRWTSFPVLALLLGPSDEAREGKNRERESEVGSGTSNWGIEPKEVMCSR